jgi:hypothetical protein
LFNRDALQKASERLLLVEKVDKTMDNMYSASIPNKIHLKLLIESAEG